LGFAQILLQIKGKFCFTSRRITRGQQIKLKTTMQSAENVQVSGCFERLLPKLSAEQIAEGEKRIQAFVPKPVMAFSSIADDPPKTGN